MADVQIAVIDDTENVVNVAVPGIQGPIGTTGSVTIAQAGTAATPGIRFESDTNTGIYSPGADQLAISTGGTGQLFVDASGNVGIGAPNPSALLDLRGSTSTRINLGVTGAANRAFLDYTESGFLTTLDADGDIRFSPNNTEAVRITTAGRVGIGTSSPVAGYTTTTVGSAAWITSGANFTVEPDAVTGANGVDLKASFSAGGNGPLKFWTAGTERLRIDSSGRVGIGTSSPTENLTIYGTGSRLAVTGESSGSAILLGNQNSGGVNNPAVIFAANGELYFGGGSSWSGGGTLDYNMFISDSGNVGIGTTTPGVKVAINDPGTGLNFTNAASGNFNIGLLGGVGSAEAYIYQRANSALLFGTNNTERLRIDSSGRVGIGTTTPRGLLSIANNAAGTGVVDSSLHFGYSLADYYGFRIVNSNEPVNLAAGLLKFQRGTVSNWIDSVVINNSGNVGIGTSNPGSLLHLADAGDISVGTTTGTKIGTATTQKIGFYNATPVVQPTAVADATDAASAITQLNALLTRMRNLGLIAT